MTFISLKEFFGGCFGDLNVLRIEFMDGVCVAAQAPTVIMTRDLILQPRALLSSSSDLYLSCFLSMVSGENRSLQ